MRSKNSIAPEKLLGSSVKSQFKPTGSFSHLCAEFILVILSIEIFFPVFTQASRSVFQWIPHLTALVIYLLLTKNMESIFNIKLDYDGLHVHSFRYLVTHMSWQDNVLIKHPKLFRTHHLILRISKHKAIQINPYSFGLSEMLHSVKYYAGEDHPLAYALEKELSRPPHHPDKFLWKIIKVIGLIISIWLIGGNLVAAQMEKPLNEAIADYKQRHPQTPPNQSAIELQALMTKLGISSDFFGDGSKTKNHPSKEDSSELSEINKPLREYLEKKLDTTDFFLDLAKIPTIETLPTKILSFLKKHGKDLKSIEDYLINNPLPARGIDGRYLDDLAVNGHPDSVSVDGLDFNVLHNLIVADIINKHQSHDMDFSNELVALNKVKQVTQEQSSYIWQLINLIHERRIIGLVQRFEQISPVWGNNLFHQGRYQKMSIAIKDEAVIDSVFVRSPKNFEVISSGTHWALLSKYHHLIEPYLRIIAADFYQKSQLNSAYWTRQNLCHTDGNVKINPVLLGDKEFALLENTQFGRSLILLTIRDLWWEFTNSVREIQTSLNSGKIVAQVAKDFAKESQICPGEKWTAQAQDNTITISFSHPPNWKALKVSDKSIIPTTYKILAGTQKTSI
jgi:hypothetical protein